MDEAGRWVDRKAHSLEDGGQEFYVSGHFDVLREIWRFDVVEPARTRDKIGDL
jgi:hypothetical protein